MNLTPEQNLLGAASVDQGEDEITMREFTPQILEAETEDEEESRVSKSNADTRTDFIELN